MFSKETLARGAVNSLAVLRAVAGPVIADKLRNTPPEKRTKKMALAVGAVAATDFIDGFITKKYLGTTKFGGWGDQIGDKIFNRFIDKALADTGEVPPYHYIVNLGRDATVTGLRIYAESQDIDTAAQPLGQAKTLIELVTKTAAASPLAENNTLINTGMVAGTGMSVVSGINYARDFIGGRN